MVKVYCDTHTGSFGAVSPVPWHLRFPSEVAKKCHSSFTPWPCWYRVTHGNLTFFEWIVLRTAPKKNKPCQCVVSTRWCHSAHCKRVDDHCSKRVSRAPHFPFPRRAVAPSLSRSFNVWFFFLWGVFEIAFLHSQTQYIEWFEGSHPLGNSSDRSSVVGPCQGRLKKKRLENCIQEDGRHLTDISIKT